MSNNNSISVDEIFVTKEFSNFLNSSRTFCLFIETENSFTKNDFLLLAQNHLLTLYSTARLIPSVIIKSYKNFEVDIPKDDLPNILKLMAERVPFSYYYSVLNPIEIDNAAEIGTGDLVDDLGDIYKDLKEGLMMFDKEDIDAKENALWKFKFDFNNHWGEHCMEALYAIHHHLNLKK